MRRSTARSIRPSRPERMAARNCREGPTSDEGVGPDRPVLARDLQTAATFAVAADLSIAAAALLIVSEDRKGERLEEAELEPEFLDLGRLVLDRIAPAERSAWAGRASSSRRSERTRRRR